MHGRLDWHTLTSFVLGAPLQLEELGHLSLQPIFVVCGTAGFAQKSRTNAAVCRLSSTYKVTSAIFERQQRGPPR